MYYRVDVDVCAFFFHFSFSLLKFLISFYSLPIGCLTTQCQPIAMLCSMNAIYRHRQRNEIQRAEKLTKAKKKKYEEKNTWHAHVLVLVVCVCVCVCGLLQVGSLMNFDVFSISLVRSGFSGSHSWLYVRRPLLSSVHTLSLSVIASKQPFINGTEGEKNGINHCLEQDICWLYFLLLLRTL